MLSITLLFLVLSSAKRPKPLYSCGCCTPEHREFDFWIGEWEVYGPQNKLAGTSSIVFIQDSCALQENCASANGELKGASYNYYSAPDKKWHRIWVDNEGCNLELTGGAMNGKMVLQSSAGRNGKNEMIRDRITWTPNADGTVRQHWEQSPDGGATWKTLFDGLYKKKR